MDMNDILNQWDSMKAKEVNKQKQSGKNQVSHKKANAPTKEEKALLEEQNFENQIKKENSKQINPIEMWLRRYGTVDKDKLATETEQRNQQTDRGFLISMNPEARIDLHGLHQDEAYERLLNFITECQKKGLKKVLIIHGKGIHTTGTDPVLGEMVRRFIESDDRCGMSGHPKTKNEGGNGATWVILKKNACN